jgi:hypothetical protein
MARLAFHDCLIVPPAETSSERYASLVLTSDGYIFFVLTGDLKIKGTYDRLSAASVGGLRRHDLRGPPPPAPSETSRRVAPLEVGRDDPRQATILGEIACLTSYHTYDYQRDHSFFTRINVTFLQITISGSLSLVTNCSQYLVCTCLQLT